MAIGASIGAKLVSYRSSHLVEEGHQQQSRVSFSRLVSPGLSSFEPRFPRIVGGHSTNKRFSNRGLTCASPKLDSPVFSTTSLVILPTSIFQIKVRT
jgi:hypothetical protein